MHDALERLQALLLALAHAHVDLHGVPRAEHGDVLAELILADRLIHRNHKVPLQSRVVQGLCSSCSLRATRSGRRSRVSRSALPTASARPPHGRPRAGPRELSSRGTRPAACRTAGPAASHRGTNPLAPNRSRPSTPGRSRTTASITASAAISPPDSTKSPSEISSVTSFRRTRSSTSL